MTRSNNIDKYNFFKPNALVTHGNKFIDNQIIPHASTPKVRHTECNLIRLKILNSEAIESYQNINQHLDYSDMSYPERNTLLQSKYS